MNPTLHQSTPILPAPHRLRGTGALRLSGAGEVVLELDGSGQIALTVRGDVSFQYTGEPAARIARPQETLWIAANGTLSIRGSEIDVRFSGGNVRAVVMGRFDATVDGRGEIETPRGGRVGWGLHPRTLRLDKGVAVEFPAAPSSGAAA